MVKKILKVLGVVFAVLLIIDFVSLLLFVYVKNNKGGVDVNLVQDIELSCSFDNNDYIISVGSDGYFNCSNCSKEIQNELKTKYIDFGDLDKTENNIREYFRNTSGSCE